ncbi:MAG TPA: 50S ribosomal protein L17 [Thermodesulfobacteriota bacterium]|nr:50S ribosomal protein L17 [Thermodesulfobacteriota bacterium]
MRHKRVGRKLGVVTKHRRAMLRNMITDLLRHERIKTTDTRAKELRRVAEKTITIAKEGTLHARRKAASIVRDKEVLKKLFDEIAKKYKDRPGGYTRIVKLGFRRGDNTPISLVELVEETSEPKRKKKSKAAPKKQQPKTEPSKAEKSEAKSQKKEAAEELGLTEETPRGGSPQQEQQEEKREETVSEPEKKSE